MHPVRYHTWRELAVREKDGLAVSLLWSNDTGRVKVAVVDAHLDEQFDVHVSGADALDASTTRSPTRRGWAPPSATPARAAVLLAPERSTVS